jgi:hypothetical protein
MIFKKLSFIFFIFLLLAQARLDSFSQDTAWQMVSPSKDVTISMPAPIHVLDTLQLKIASSNLGGYIFQIKLIKPSITVHSGDELVQAYESFIHGYLTSKDVSIYNNVVTDTSFGVTEGKWIHSTYAQSGNFEEMFTYAVLINSHFYMITFASGHPSQANDRALLSKYFGSLSFPQAPISEYSDKFRLQSRSYRFGEKVGRYAPYFILLFVAGLPIYFIYRRLLKKRHSRTY